MQFQVPQFIDISPKIVGPLTLKQFLIIASAIVPVFILFFILNFFVWLIIALVFGGSSIAIALVKIRGQSLLKILIAAFNYFWKPRYYIWKRVDEKINPEELQNIPDIQTAKPKRPPLRDLFLKLTTTTKPIAKREKPTEFLSSVKSSRERFSIFRKTTGERDKARRADYR